jgi:hypothetical protein
MRDRRLPLSRGTIPLRGKTQWRMRYQTTARASNIAAINVEHLELEQRRAPVRGQPHCLGR